jgi:hypothetical protein
MIGGIFGTIGKTLGLGKNKYFLELDDAAEQRLEDLQGAASKAIKAAKETVEDITDKAQSVAEETADKAQAAAKTVKAQAPKATKTAVKAQAPAKALPKGKTSIKAKAAAEKGASAEPTAAPQPVAAPVAAAPRSPEDIIVSAIAAGGKAIDSSGNVVDKAQNFATDYLMPTANSSRRRPGPSLGNFKGMARTVNPRLKS